MQHPTALRRLSPRTRSIGLVVFSDVPYELLPPGTPASELRPMLRLLVPPRARTAREPVDAHVPRRHAHLGRARARAGDARARRDRDRVDPARQRPRDRAGRRPVSRADVAEHRPAGFELRVVPLAPSSDARASSRGSSRRTRSPGSRERAPDGAEPDEARPEPGSRPRCSCSARSSSSSLAAHERFAGRLALPRPSAPTEERREPSRADRRCALGAGALVCLVLALVLGLLALDVSGRREALSSGRRPLPVSPERRGALARPRRCVPFDLAASLLGHRTTTSTCAEPCASVRLARLDGHVSVSDPELALLRNEAQVRLEAIVAGEQRSEAHLALPGSSASSACRVWSRRPRIESPRSRRRPRTSSSRSRSTP